MSAGHSRRPNWWRRRWPSKPSPRPQAVSSSVMRSKCGADNRRILVDFSLKAVQDEEGKVVLLVPEGRDISDLKATQARLHEAQKVELLGQLTGGVAHDFNN